LRCTKGIDTEGYGPLYKTAVVFLMTLFPILLNTTSSIRNVDNSLARMVRSFGARASKSHEGIVEILKLGQNPEAKKPIPRRDRGLL
jgi:hypothetical protein